MRGDCPIRMKKLVNGCLLLFALGCGSPAAFAQWVTQTITLNPGWNAVYLEVQPANSDCDAVFAGIPVESVWAWNRRFSSVQFIQDANQLVPGQPDWLVYLPSDQPARATRNLFAVQGARAYLIKLKMNFNLSKLLLTINKNKLLTKKFNKKLKTKTKFLIKHLNFLQKHFRKI